MPHECTECGAVYEDGSTQMLEGCEDCGGTTFIFTKSPGGAAAVPGGDGGAEGAGAGKGPVDGVSDAGEDDAQSRARSDVATPDGDGEAEATAGTGAASAGDAEPTSATTGRVDGANGDAEPDQHHVVDADRPTAPGGDDADEPDDADDEHPPASSGDSGDGELVTPDVDEIREELMAQFESIKIVEPGSYELNLMNLYDRDEKIIALQEDGRYQVSLPSALDD